MNHHKSLAWGVALALAALGTHAAHVADAYEERAQKTGEIPTCSLSLGTLAVVEPQGTN